MIFRFSCNGGSEGHEDLYTDTIRQVIDHVLVQHFQTFAYECDNCSLTFNTKVTFIIRVGSDIRQLSISGRIPDIETFRIPVIRLICNAG